MGFSIGSFLGKIAGPVIGALTGSPLLGAGVSAGFAGVGGAGGSVGPSAALAPAHAHASFGAGFGLHQHGQYTTEAIHREAHRMGAQPFFGGGATPSFPQVAQFGGTAVIARGIGATGIVGLIASLFAVSRDRTGQPINRKKVAAAVRVCGISMAAQMFALSELEICQIVISKGRRRGRGISAADLRRTRATLRKVHNIQHDLGRVKAVRRHHK